MWVWVYIKNSHMVEGFLELTFYIQRSSDDGYTPPGHVDQLQDKLVGVVNRLCNGQIHVQRHY